MTQVSIAYSPDSDDAFMMEGLRSGKVDSGEFELTFFRDDIQVLNEAAREGRYDITAISMAAYPSLADQYLLLPVGASVGDDFGPALVVKPESDLVDLEALSKKAKEDEVRIAVPGLQTSAYFAASGVLPPFTPVPAHFLAIPGLVLRGEVDAGILIHELQMQPENAGLRRLACLGQLWRQRYGVPLPLGGNAIKRSLGEVAIFKLADLLRQSINWGLSHREATLKTALDEATAGVDPILGNRYIDMYVNHHTLALGEDVAEGLTKLLELGASKGLCAAIDVRSHLVL